MSTHPVETLLARSGPRKILAIDGGGIRGVIALGAIAEIERMLRRLSGNNDLVLADYFDLIAGTSTGAVIAAGLSAGMTVAALEDLYLHYAPRIFVKSGMWTHLSHYKFASEGLRTILQNVLGDMTLGSERLRTLLLIVLRNASTDSPWPLTNNPRAKYNDRANDDCNLDLPLWQLVRASAAAPTFFPSEMVELGNREKTRMEFVDGGTTPYNNPAFLAFLMATVDRYRVGWQTGPGQLLVVSAGTGQGSLARIDRRALAPADQTGETADFQQASKLEVAMTLPLVQLGNSSVEQDVLCRIFGDCVEGEAIDGEIGDLKQCAGPCLPKLFTYARYNLKLTARDFMRYGLEQIDPNHLALDAYERLDDLREVGRFLAGRVKASHFADFPLHDVPADVWRQRATASGA